jgi:glycosyltransferase 2 family protein
VSRPAIPTAGEPIETKELSSVNSAKTTAHHVQRAFWTAVRLSIAGALLFYLAKSGIIDEHAVVRSFTAWPIAIAAIVLILFDTWLMAIRLAILFRPLGLHLTISQSMKLTLVGIFFRTFLPGVAGGDAVKLFYAAKGLTGRRVDIVTIMLFDRAIGMFSLLIMPLLFAPFLPRSVWESRVIENVLAACAIVSGCMLLGFALCISFAGPLDRVVKWILRSKRIAALPGQMIRAVGMFGRHLVRAGEALGLSLVANSALVVVMMMAVVALNPSSADWKMCLLIPVGFIANSLPITPGGLGVGEAAFNELFKMAGLHGGGGALLCWRIWFTLVSLSGLWFYVRGVGKSVRDVRAMGGEENAEREEIRSPVGSVSE